MPIEEHDAGSPGSAPPWKLTSSRSVTAVWASQPFASKKSRLVGVAAGRLRAVPAVDSGTPHISSIEEAHC